MSYDCVFKLRLTWDRLWNVTKPSTALLALGAVLIACQKLKGPVLGALKPTSGFGSARNLSSFFYSLSFGLTVTITLNLLHLIRPLTSETMQIVFPYRPLENVWRNKVLRICAYKMLTPYRSLFLVYLHIHLVWSSPCQQSACKRIFLLSSSSNCQIQSKTNFKYISSRCN